MAWWWQGSEVEIKHVGRQDNWNRLMVVGGSDASIVDSFPPEAGPHHPLQMQAVAGRRGQETGGFPTLHPSLGDA